MQTGLNEEATHQNAAYKRLFRVKDTDLKLRGWKRYFMEIEMTRKWR